MLITNSITNNGSFISYIVFESFPTINMTLPTFQLEERMRFELIRWDELQPHGSAVIRKLLQEDFSSWGQPEQAFWNSH